MKKQTAEDTSINITIDQILNIIYANESNVNRYIRYKEFADIKTLLYKSQGCVYTAYVSKSIESKRLALVELVTNLSVARSIIRHLGESGNISLKTQHNVMLKFSIVIPQAQGWLTSSQ